MKIVARYSFKGGEKVIHDNYSSHLSEIEGIVSRIDSTKYRSKVSKEKTMKGLLLYAPKRLNKAFKREFGRLKWVPVRVPCGYSREYYAEDYHPAPNNKGAFREMDFVKDDLGVEVQFGKYAFMVYNVCAKMTIFSNLGHIKAGVEIVPVKHFAEHMSSGVSYFEQFSWDLKTRGESNIDIPVLILGIDA